MPDDLTARLKALEIAAQPFARLYVQWAELPDSRDQLSMPMANFKALADAFFGETLPDKKPFPG